MYCLRMTLLILLITLITPLPVLTAPHAAKDIALPGFKSPALSLEELGGVSEQIQIILDARIAELRARGKKEKKINGDATVIACRYLQTEVAAVRSAVEHRAVTAAVRHRHLRAMRVLYSVVADQQEPVKVGFFRRLGSAAVMGGRLLGKGFVIRVPRQDPDRALGGMRAAMEEAADLADGKGRPLTAEGLAELTPRQISLLEPRLDSRSFSAFSRLKGMDRYDALVRMVEADTRAFDKKYQDFNFADARRVFIFQKVKDSATSPKIDVEDRFGIDWKLKWGDEVHTEPFMTAIYVALGGTHADIKFYIPAGSAPIVLARPGQDGIHTLDELQTAMLESKYKFHLDRYVVAEGLQRDKENRLLGHGQVDADFCARTGLDRKHIGAWYFHCKEALVSYAAPTIARLGPAAFSTLGAERSRAPRGSVVFNTLFCNKDCKDDNNRVAILWSPKTGTHDRVVEYQHDLGCALGGARTSGDLNKYGWEFIRKLPGALGFQMRSLYIPDAWRQATLADAMWMARKIAQLPPQDFRRALKLSGWPGYAQELAFQKIMSRRNEMVKAFTLDREGIGPVPVNPRLTLTLTGPDGKPDTPVLNGVLQSPAKSRLVRYDSEHFHPEGLDKVVSRMND